MTSVLPHACTPERQPARPLAESSPAALARRRRDDAHAVGIAEAAVEGLRELGRAGAGSRIEQIAVVGVGERRGEHDGKSKRAHAGVRSKTRATRKPARSGGAGVRFSTRR
jgi:hypothetical protein